MAERPSQSLATRLVSPIVQLRHGEAVTALLMFAYSFLAMAGYNMIKPVTRGLFIEKLGAENLPWVQFGAGIVIGLIMQGYTRVISRVPRRSMIPITLAAIVILMTSFYLYVRGFPHEPWRGRRLLPVRADHRHPPHQPVLDAGQRRLRSASGQAHLRLRGCRREPGGVHRRDGDVDDRRQHRHQRGAPGQRRHACHLHDDGDVAGPS